MDDEVLNKLVAQVSAVERVVTLLLSDALKRLPPDELMLIVGALKPEMVVPKVQDTGTADYFAGRAMEYQRVVQRILEAAQEIAAPSAG